MVDHGGVVRGDDGVRRCWWGAAPPEYASYHDDEWGRPVTDDVRIYEKLSLEGFQSGLSWLTILRKRDGFRRAFHDFDPARIARYAERDVARLMADPGIVRNRLKVEATVDNAKAYLALRKTRTLASFLWEQAGGTPRINRAEKVGDVPAATDVSLRISKALKKQGFRFVGPTTVYSFMQATGMVNDHLIGCPRHAACAKLQRAFVPPTT